MTDKDYEIARLLRKRLDEKVRLVDMRVFGSRARGDAESDSDMDVFVEMEDGDGEFVETVHEIAWEVGFLYLMHISPTIFTRNEVTNSPMKASPILSNILREGIAV